MKAVMRIKVIRLSAVFLVLFAGSALAGGGDWKIGPFGPYWDDNDWPEFTPMYWMEEFMNRLDDDDEEIQDWMRMNQYPAQAPRSSLPEQPYSAWNPPYQPEFLADGFRPNPSLNNRPRTDYFQSEPRREDQRREYSRPAPKQLNMRLPELTPQEFERMPRRLQREYERAYMERYIPNNRGRGDINARRNENRGYRPQRRSKKSACFFQ